MREADIRLVLGPAMIRDKNGMFAGYVHVDVGSYVAEVERPSKIFKLLPLQVMWEG